MVFIELTRFDCDVLADFNVPSRDLFEDQTFVLNHDDLRERVLLVTINEWERGTQCL